MSTPSDVYAELTEDRLAVISGIYVTVWKDVQRRKSPLSMSVNLGMSRYCEALAAYELAARAHPWLTVTRQGLYYHLTIEGVVLRVDRLDGLLQPAQNFLEEPPGGHANLWLDGVQDLRTPYLCLEVDLRASEPTATLRLLSHKNAGAASTEHDRWSVEVASVPLVEILGWEDLPELPETVAPVEDDPVPPTDGQSQAAEFKIRPKKDPKSETGDED